MLRVTCTQLVRLLNRDIVAYIVEEGKLSQGQVFYKNKEETDQQFLIPEEQKIARWVYENNKRAGVGTNYFKNAKCLYLAIRIGDHVYGCLLYTSGVAGIAIIAILSKVKPALFDNGLSKIIDWFSVLDRFNDFCSGILNASSIVYYVSFIAVFLFLTMQGIEKRRWN